MLQDKNNVSIKYEDKLRDELVNQDVFRAYSKTLAESIAEQIGCSPDSIKITPALRVYEFNDANIPREPRIWLRVRYNAGFPAIDKEKLIKKAGGSILTI